MTNASRRGRRPCKRCGGPLPEGRRRSRLYCSDRCRWAAAQAAFRERDREGYNARQAEAMRRRRARAMLGDVARQAAAHERHKRARLPLEEAMGTFAALLRRTAAWDAVRGIAPLERWREEKVRERRA